MKKILAALVALCFAALAFAGPASATRGEDTPADNKKVEFCHYDGSNDNGGSGKYSKIEISISAFYNAGHIDHTNDIWATFSYTTKGGEVVTVQAQGDQSLLEFDNCEAPKEPEAVTPTVTVVDKCGTENDSVSVPKGRGYTSTVTQNGNEYTVSVTADEDFKLVLDNTWTVSDDGQRASKVFTLTDEDCDLPETGGEAQHNATLGLFAMGGIVLLGSGLLLIRKRS